MQRLSEAKAGCVGMSTGGRYLLEYEGSGTGLQLLLWESTASGFQVVSQAPIELPNVPADALADESLLAAARRQRFEACTASKPAPGGGGKLVLDRPFPVAIEVETLRSIRAHIEGNAPARFRPPSDADGFDFQQVYWSKASPRVFLAGQLGEIRASQGDRTGLIVTLEGGRALIALPPAALGESGCTPRALDAPALAAAEPPPFTASPGRVDCVAMTKDGMQAAFKVYKTGPRPRDVQPSHIAWYAADGASHPDIDLDCMTHGSCTKDQRAALDARAAELGLVGCANVTNALAVDGRAVPLKRGNGAVRVKSGSGWRAIYEYDTAHDYSWGEVYPVESIWKLVQHPHGGPLFVYSGFDNQRAMGEEWAGVTVVDAAQMNLCPAPPDDALPLASAAASSSEAAASVGLGTAQAIDGDLTTAWQVDSKKNVGAPWLSVSLAEATPIAAVEIANGWQRRDGNGDYFELNARVRTGTLSFDDGTSEPIALTPDARGFSHIALAQPHTTKTVKLTIDARIDGTRWPADVSISELRLIAAR
ncbi:MAG: discoidin domain-containing protein [Myxococcota bacterium]